MAVVLVIFNLLIIFENKWCGDCLFFLRNPMLLYFLTSINCLVIAFIVWRIYNFDKKTESANIKNGTDEKAG